MLHVPERYLGLSEPSPPMTLGSAAKAELRLVVWCRIVAALADRHNPAVRNGPLLGDRMRIVVPTRSKQLGHNELSFSGISAP